MKKKILKEKGKSFEIEVDKTKGSKGTQRG